MTSIAFDGRYLACDSQTTAGDLKATTMKYRELTLPDGPVVVVLAGVAHHLDPFCAALIAGDEYNVPEDTSIGVLRKGGALTWHISEGRTFPSLAPDCTGSGGQAVAAGLHLGMRADEAVALACAVDLYSSGPVHCWDSKTMKKIKPKAGR